MAKCAVSRQTRTREFLHFSMRVSCKASCLNTLSVKPPFWLLVFLIICFVGRITVLPLDAQSLERPTIEEILGDNEPTGESLTSSAITYRWNPFLRTDSTVLKLGLFAGLALMTYCVIVIGFNRALEKGERPLPAFFRFNRVFLLSILLLSFICFSEYTVRSSRVAISGFRDHFTQIDWLFWGAATALIAALHAGSKWRRLRGSENTRHRV